VDFILGIVRRFGVWIVILAIIGGVGFVFRDHLTGAAAELRVGDCFDEPAEMAGGEGSTEVKDVQHRPCGDPHDGEVFAVAKHSADRSASYPSDDAMIEFVAGQCVPAFDTYTGTAYADALEYDFAWFYPTPDGWSKGDRDFTCYAFRTDGAKLTASVKAQAP
jgi:hypothetical protein